MSGSLPHAPFQKTWRAQAQYVFSVLYRQQTILSPLSELLSPIRGHEMHGRTKCHSSERPGAAEQPSRGKDDGGALHLEESGPGSELVYGFMVPASLCPEQSRQVNLEFDTLDTPDVFWEFEEAASQQQWTDSSPWQLHTISLARICRLEGAHLCLCETAFRCGPANQHRQSTLRGPCSRICRLLFQSRFQSGGEQMVLQPAES